MNNRLLLSGGTLTGDLRLSRTTGNSRVLISTNDSSATADVMIYFQHGANSTSRIGTVGPSGASRPLEISTGWNLMPIVARQYGGSNTWTTIMRELTLLDRDGNTIIPGHLTVLGNVHSNSIYPIGSVFIGNSAPSIGTWNRIGIQGTHEITPTLASQFSFNGRIIFNGTNFCQVSFSVSLNVQNVNQLIDLTTYGLRASSAHAFNLNEISNATDALTILGHARSNNVRVDYNMMGGTILIDTNLGSTVKFMQYVITLTCSIFNYDTVLGLSNTLVSVFRRVT